VAEHKSVVCVPTVANFECLKAKHTTYVQIAMVSM
jgi:hypothetical protein